MSTHAEQTSFSQMVFGVHMLERAQLHLVNRCGGCGDGGMAIPDLIAVCNALEILSTCSHSLRTGKAKK